MFTISLFCCRCYDSHTCCTQDTLKNYSSKRAAVAVERCNCSHLTLHVDAKNSTMILLNICVSEKYDSSNGFLCFAMLRLSITYCSSSIYCVEPARGQCVAFCWSALSTWSCDRICFRGNSAWARSSAQPRVGPNYCQMSCFLWNDLDQSRSCREGTWSPTWTMSLKRDQGAQTPHFPKHTYLKNHFLFFLDLPTSLTVSRAFL